ncbi:MAG: hypothetical protein Q7R84_00920 [bacterium]|nr:hypothetical protein [bacterium]
MATEQVIHFNGWLDPDPELGTRMIKIVHLISCVSSSGPLNSYRITFVDQFGKRRVMEVTQEWKAEIMSARKTEIMLTIRKVVVSAQIVSGFEGIDLAGPTIDVGQVS